MPGPRITVQTGIIRLECHTFRLTFRRTGMSTTDDDVETRPIIYTPMPLRSLNPAGHDGRSHSPKDL